MSFIDLSLGDGEIRQAWGIRSMKLGALALSLQKTREDTQGGKEHGIGYLRPNTIYLGAKGALQGKDGKICYICLILPSCVMADIGNYHASLTPFITSECFSKCSRPQPPTVQSW